MANDLEVCLEQLSPLLDDVVKHMRTMELSAGEYIALGFLASADLSARVTLTIPNGKQLLTPEQCECIQSLLKKKQRHVDEIVAAAAKKYIFRAWEQ